ncbi:hypothetical protein M8C13_04550 [Crossiella sp. SN42]|uniref:hypothetical protein n=1 Tax=Crossiella sp. SN42 TaxID=2944808 RepID=UPI00207CDC9F|nr:hypothetical protein [Crossiella sp. SN42]MCO1575029.1 hypothetical protein [Crossiella sp. SN42]
MTQSVRMKWNGAKVSVVTRGGAVEGLGKATEHLLGVASQLAPIEEGTLERSGVASVDEVNLRGAVSFDTVYAVRQHEELTWRHDPGRQAKYLEEPADTEADTMTALVAAAIRRAYR